MGDSACLVGLSSAQALDRLAALISGPQEMRSIHPGVVSDSQQRLDQARTWNISGAAADHVGACCRAARSGLRGREESTPLRSRCCLSSATACAFNGGGVQNRGPKTRDTPLAGARCVSLCGCVRRRLLIDIPTHITTGREFL